jgi:hypothetical protein
VVAVTAAGAEQRDAVSPAIVRSNAEATVHHGTEVRGVCAICADRPPRAGRTHRARHPLPRAVDQETMVGCLRKVSDGASPNLFR